MKTFKDLMRKLKKSSSINYATELCFLVQNNPRKTRCFSVRFTDRDLAVGWIEKVIERFKGHKEFPLQRALLVVIRKNGEPAEVLEGSYFDDIIPEVKTDTKILYLWNDDTNDWKAYKYEKLSDLALDFAVRDIRIGHDCQIDNYCRLDNGSRFGTRCKLGAWCRVAKGCRLGDGCRVGAWCELNIECKLGDRCKLDEECKLGARCRLGDGCELEKRFELGSDSWLGSYCILRVHED